jgi:long-chain acyl-CoA synthetase
MNVAHLLERTARTFPGRPALFHGKHLLCDYRALARRASGLGAALRQRLGLQAGERVAVLSRNHPHYLEVLQGAWYAGLVVVPINSKLHPREVEYILSHSGASVLFTSDGQAAELQLGGTPLSAHNHIIDMDSAAYMTLVESAPMPVTSRQPQDVAWLFYTSGTTGRPKGVMQTHRNLMSMTLCYFSDVDTIDASDASLYAAPMSHGAGLYTLPHILAGARHVVPESGGFDPEEIARLARELRGISMFAAPTMVKRMVDHAKATGGHGEGIKTVVYGGGPMYEADIQEAMRVMGPRFVQIYGQGECPMAITALSRHHLQDRLHPRHAQRLASVGVAQSHVEVRVVQPDGQPMPVGEAGELVVRGDTVMAGYWQDESATANALAGGWLRTGDVGELDEDGFLTLRDRSKDLIISGGSNIYPREVEEVLLRHPAVQEVAVIGRPHAEWGEEVAAYVVQRPGHRLEMNELDALCMANIARFKRPRHYRLIHELPKNNYGKVLKTTLRVLDAKQPH